MQRIHPAAHLMLCAWVFTGVVTSADESEHRVDALKLKQFQRSVNIIEIRRAELDEAREEVEADYLARETAELARLRAEKTLERIEGGKTIAELAEATDHGHPVRQAGHRHSGRWHTG